MSSNNILPTPAPAKNSSPVTGAEKTAAKPAAEKNDSPAADTALLPASVEQTLIDTRLSAAEKFDTLRRTISPTLAVFLNAGLDIEQFQWFQADHHNETCRVLITSVGKTGECSVVWPDGTHGRSAIHDLAPRLDLPRCDLSDILG